MSVTGVNSDLFKLPQFQQNYGTYATAVNSDTSIYTQYNQATTQQTVAEQPEEEKKDGFFSKLWGGIKGAVKGVVKGAVNMVKGAIKNPLKTLAIVGACCIPVVGPWIAGGLCAYGVVTGGAKVISGIGQGLQADTAAEAEAAGEQVGEGALTAGLSMVGLKASAGAIKAAHVAGKSAVATSGSTGVNAAKAYLNGATGNPAGATASWGQLGSHMAKQTGSNMVAVAKAMSPKNLAKKAKAKYQNVKEGYHNIKDAYNSNATQRQTIKDAKAEINRINSDATLDATTKNNLIAEQQKIINDANLAKTSYSKTTGKIRETYYNNKATNQKIKDIDSQIAEINKTPEAELTGAQKAELKNLNAQKAELANGKKTYTEFGQKVKDIRNNQTQIKEIDEKIANYEQQLKDMDSSAEAYWEDGLRSEIDKLQGQKAELIKNGNTKWTDLRTAKDPTIQNLKSEISDLETLQAKQTQYENLTNKTTDYAKNLADDIAELEAKTSGFSTTDIATAKSNLYQAQQSALESQYGTADSATIFSTNSGKVAAGTLVSNGTTEAMKEEALFATQYAQTQATTVPASTYTVPEQYSYDTSQIQTPMYFDAETLNGLQSDLNNMQMQNMIMANGGMMYA